MNTQLVYAIRYVADMDAAVAFYRDRLGLPLRYATPHWSEFDTGATTLALHPASAEHPAGTCQVGFRVADIDAFHAEHAGQDIRFTSPPTLLHGHKLARFLDADGAECSLSG
ncbi:MAG: VOC family protein [Xanthomonadales bacterium]|nr:VOC family protein [Xanthomonadales bacterium]